MTADAAAAISSAYRFEIRAVLPRRSVVALYTSIGKWMCKRYTTASEIDTDRLLAVGSVKEQLADQGLCPRPLRTADGSRLLRLDDGSRVVVEPWIRGRHANLKLSDDRAAAAQALARLHKACVRIPFILRHPPTIVQKLSYRLQAASEAAAAGELFGLSRDEWEDWRACAESALRAAPTRTIARLTEEDRQSGVLCHRDLAPHNILIEPGVPACLIDYDLSGCDSPLYDLYQLYGHAAFVIPDHDGLLTELVGAYRRVGDLPDGHVAALRALLPFPAQLLREIADCRRAHGARARARASVRVRCAAEAERRRLEAVTGGRP